MADPKHYSPSQLEAMNYQVVQEGDNYYIKHVTTNEDGTEASSEIKAVLTKEEFDVYTQEYLQWEADGRPTTFDSEMEDDMIKSYDDSNLTSQTYFNNLSNEGLKITDLRYVFGIPSQFLPNTDPRLDSPVDTEGIRNSGPIGSIGRVYGDKIIGYFPLLLITPGVPQFMANFSRTQRSTILSLFSNDEDADSIINAIFGDFGGKYYSLKFAYTEYYKYVNAMLRSAAVFLDLQNVEIPGVNNNLTKLGYYQWFNDTTVQDAGVFKGTSKFLGPYAGALAFYADAGNSVDDSFSNSTTQSSLFSSINELSSKAQELNFLAGTAGSLAGINVGDILGTSADSLTDRVSAIKKAVGGNNIFAHILGKAQTILAGGKMIFPEIWSDSNFSRSYSVKLKLVAPAGDKLSIFLNILVPIYHIVALVLPRQAEAQSYFSPFLVRAYYKSLFNVDMGIITSLNLTKGAEGEWTKDGLPTVAEVSFEIKDLYEAMSMSSMDGASETRILSNIQELDYIANSCGININDQEIMRTITLYKALTVGKLKDTVQIGIFGEIRQYFNQKVQNIFGRFK